MSVKYVANIRREGDQWLADFPDAPGCQTFASTPDALARMASDALVGWLEAHLASGQVPARPEHRAASEAAFEVEVPWRLALRVWPPRVEEPSAESLAEIPEHDFSGATLVTDGNLHAALFAAMGDRPPLPLPSRPRAIYRLARFVGEATPACSCCERCAHRVVERLMRRPEFL